MITYRTKGMALIYCLSLAAAAGLAFWIWIAFYFGVFRMVQPVSLVRYGLYTALIGGSFFLDYLSSRRDRAELTKLNLPDAIRISTRQTVTCVLVVCFYLVVSRDTAISRLFFVCFVPLLLVFLVAVNRVMPKLLGAALFPAHRQLPTLLVGSRSQIVRARNWLEGKSHYGIDIIGFVSDDDLFDLPWRRCGGSGELWSAVEATGAAQLMLLELPDSLSEAGRIATRCENLGVRLLMINDLAESYKRPLHYFEDSGVQFVGFRQEPLECPFNRAMKRALDLAFALPVVLFVLPPLAVLVYLLQRFQSPGPLFCRQIRTGIYSKGFSIWKFRTMHLSEVQDSTQAQASDDRIYPAGRWLRRLSLDEIPQFINVLQGQMSVVGPRPHLLEHDDRFGKLAASYRVRSLVKPGITGWAQVRGQRGEVRAPEDIIERVRSDVYYLENWSFALDWLIIMQTTLHVIRPPRTAY